METDIMHETQLQSAVKLAPRYLTNNEAAEFLRLSPHTLEEERVIGDGPRFRKLRRCVMYSIDDLESWADARSFEMTSDPEYASKRIAAR